MICWDHFAAQLHLTKKELTKTMKQNTQISSTEIRVISAYHQSIVHTSYNCEIDKGNNVRHQENYMLVVKHNFTTTKKRNKDINKIA